MENSGKILKKHLNIVLYEKNMSISILTLWQKPSSRVLAKSGKVIPKMKEIDENNFLVRINQIYQAELTASQQQTTTKNSIILPKLAL